MEYISRHMEARIMELSCSYSAILLTGPRQAGKTTMLRKLAEKEKIGRRYVTLDDLAERDMAKNDPALFLQLHQPPVLIDEVQYAPELFAYIKIHIDKFHNPGDFWMTGSQIFRLMRGVQESLAGRVALLHMSPLSQREITGAACAPFTTDMERLLAERDRIRPVSTPELFGRLWQGSMPGLISGQIPDRNVFYSSYLSTYIERDVREFSGSVDALKFNRFVTSAAARCSQLLNYKAMADDADIDVQTAKDWINILETLGIVFLLHPYSNNVLKRTIKTPKLYFYDTGLVCYLTRWSSPEVAETGAMSGALLENFTVSEIVKGYQNAGLEPYLYFYRDRDAKEIDVVLEGDGKLCPLEIKKTAVPDRRLVRVFSVLEKSSMQVGTGAILCMADAFSAFDRNHLIVPIWMI
ncbi:MAG: ATP-binding protein [Succiniclasticum sp.]|uniref:ATP-binding protein n=1 Tax=Succiniclasticum sp. TaxID=2775030 RepID=UPI002A90AAC0|nr:ATP-binding protein [Succiniclasticum sp.]MBR1494707.1 ATP-binding protein [Acidaminococcaceae bacterium]MDY6290539.1 ATP-binding protein [Succiniclasticum sp.]